MTPTPAPTQSHTFQEQMGPRKRGRPGRNSQEATEESEPLPKRPRRTTASYGTNRTAAPERKTEKQTKERGYRYQGDIIQRGGSIEDDSGHGKDAADEDDGDEDDLREEKKKKSVVFRHLLSIVDSVVRFPVQYCTRMSCS